MAGSHEVRGSIPLCSTKYSQVSGIVAGLFPFKTDIQPTFCRPVYDWEPELSIASFNLSRNKLAAFESF